MDDYLKCRKCPNDTHEGQFCRCEMRNIRIAKEKRKRGESAWKAQKQNKFTHEMSM